MSFAENFAKRSQARRGRPRRAIPTIPICVRLDEQVYDEYSRKALAERVSLNSILQRTLTTAARRPSTARNF